MDNRLTDLYHLPVPYEEQSLYLLELRETGADIIFTNGQTMPELLAISVFRSTMKALALVEAVAVQELNALCGGDDMEPEQPTMFF